MTPREKAQAGVQLIEEAILEILGTTEDQTNAEVTRQLGLESDQEGMQKDYLAYSVLGRLMKRGLVQKVRAKIDGRSYVGYLKGSPPPR